MPLSKEESEDFLDRVEKVLVEELKNSLSNSVDFERLGALFGPGAADPDLAPFHTSWTYGSVAK